MTTTNNVPLSDEAMKFIVPVLEHYQKTNPQDEAARNKLRTFLHAAAEVHPAPPTDAYLEYFTDAEKGKEVISKLGTNATFGDLDAAIKNGTMTQ